MSRTTQVLWGFRPGTAPEPIKITGGTAAECRREQKTRNAAGWVCGIYPEFTPPRALRDLAATVTSGHVEDLGFTVTRSGEPSDYRVPAEPGGFAWTCRTTRLKGGTGWDRGQIVEACEITSASRDWYDQHAAYHERTGPQPVTLPKPWKAPARTAQYAPAAMAAGQAVTWTLITPGHWERPDGMPVTDPVTGGPTGQWIESASRTRTGRIWSDGPRGTSWWVNPDDEPASPVVVRRHGKSFSFERAEGQLYEETGWQGWREEIRRAENVRRRGLYPVVTETFTSSGYYSPRDPHKVVRWHADPQCPDAAGLEPDDGKGAAYGRDGNDGKPWTPLTATDALTGRVSYGGELPFCKHCIMLEPRPEPAGDTPAYAGTGDLVPC